METIRMMATGDSFITRRLPVGDPYFENIANLIHQADVRFTNLETTVHRMEGAPSAQSGGTWAVSPPEVLQDLKAYGFNMLNCATNHTLDYGAEGLLATQKYLNEYGFIYAGAGRNLSEASQVKYLETSSGRVAMIAFTSTFHESWMAGEQRRDVAGRPGVNGLRFETTYQVNESQLEQLREIAAQTGINDQLDLSRKEGFAPQEEKGQFSFGEHSFVTSSDGMVGKRTSPHARDWERIRRSIHEAKRQADYVIVSIHSHEVGEGRKDLAAEFLVTVARDCIDAGAHAIIGHGPHILRGIEIYKERPIFYSLGNFIFQNETVEYLPSDFYEKYGLANEHTVADALDTRTDDGKRGLATNPGVWKSVIADWTMKDGRLHTLDLHPIELGFGEARYTQGWPRLSNDSSILTELVQLSEELGTDLSKYMNRG